MKNNVFPMWVLNITPDSFSEPGQWMKQSTKWLSIIEGFQGPFVLDVGAESTAPFKQAISHAEEMERLDHFFFSHAGGIKKNFLLSIDTYKIETISWCLEKIQKLPQVQGVIWNDVSGQYSDGVKEILKSHPQLQYVVSHNKVTSRADTLNHYQYAGGKEGKSNILDEINLFFHQAIDYFKTHALNQRILLDPAFGFAKSREDNWTLLENLAKVLRDFYEYKFLIGISRKSFLRDKDKKYADPGQAEKTLMQESMIIYSLLQQKPYHQKLYWRTHHTSMIDYLNS